jgi:uncharacterized membrane protein YidH (DUF202 family)
MRRNFTEHAANERTLLAWVRTSIAIIALGFVVEKFTLFLRYMSLALHEPRLPGSRHTESLGVALVVLGSLMAMIATMRFVIIRREINQGTERFSSWPDILLGFLLVLTGLFLAFYLSERFFG